MRKHLKASHEDIALTTPRGLSALEHRVLFHVHSWVIHCDQRNNGRQTHLSLILDTTYENDRTFWKSSTKSTAASMDPSMHRSRQ